MKSKAQVTLFIIMGVILLIGIALVYYLRTAPDEALPYEVKKAEELPDEFSPVSDFVTACLSRTFMEALTKLGNRGGYIQPENYNIEAVTGDATSGGAVQFSPRSPLKVPYWFLMKSDNRCRGACEFWMLKPPLHAGSARDNSIEAQISEYVAQNIERCTNNFVNFRSQSMDIVRTGEISAKTTVTQDDVAVTLYYPLKITQGNVAKEVNQFTAGMDINLRRIYELASSLTELEAEFRYLEHDALNMIAIFSGVDKEKLPPMSELQFKFGGAEAWTKTNVKNNIQAMLMSYIPLLKVTNTANYEPYIGENRYDNALYNIHSTIPLNQSFNDLEVRFTYLDFWPIYFDLNCDGEYCSAESVSTNILSLMGIQRYNFAYDVSFPVMVEIYDRNALKGQGYNFRYFLEANIRNNAELKADFNPVQMVNTNPSSLLCKQSSRNSGEIVVAVKEGEVPLDGVEVMYSCAGETCYIGRTENGAYVGKFPICLGGIVTLNKEGYLARSELVSTELEKSATVEAKMLKVRTVNVEIEKKKMLLSNGEWVFDGSAHKLGEKEYGTATFRRVGELMEDSVIATADFRHGENATVDLAPGQYEVEVRIFTDEQVVIPEDRRCEGALFTEKCFTIPKVEINESYPNGVAKINVTITESDLKQGRVTVYAVSPSILDVPLSERKIEMLEQINKAEEYASENKASLKPRFG